MSWDSKAIMIIATVWVALGWVYEAAIGMITGARAWWSGGAILLLVLFALGFAEWRARAGQGLRLWGVSAEPAEARD